MPISKQEISILLDKYDEFGKIAENDIALCFALKKHRRSQKGEEFNAFVFNYQEIKMVFKSLMEMLDSNQAFSFQFAHKISGKVNVPDGHWTFGDIQFTPSNRELKVFLCDPLGLKESEELFCLLVDSGFDFYSIPEICSLSIFYPQEKLQYSQKKMCFFQY